MALTPLLCHVSLFPLSGYLLLQGNTSLSIMHWIQLDSRWWLGWNLPPSCSCREMIASLAFCVIFILDNGKEILVNYDYLKKYGSGSSSFSRISDRPQRQYTTQISLSLRYSILLRSEGIWDWSETNMKSRRFWSWNEPFKRMSHFFWFCWKYRNHVYSKHFVWSTNDRITRHVSHKSVW